MPSASTQKAFSKRVKENEVRVGDVYLGKKQKSLTWPLFKKKKKQFHRF